MKIIDGFIFNNELDLLLYRLSILNDYIDYFILVEATHTFSGIKKPLYYSDNKEKFSKFEAKIIHIIVDDFYYVKPEIDYSYNQQWLNEEYQRNCIEKGIDLLKLEKEDIIITSDLDEICDYNILKKIKNNELHYYKDYLNRLELDMYIYNLNTKCDCHWYGIKLLTYEAFKTMGLTFEELRKWEWTNEVPIIKKGGWHLSYFGDVNFIQKKISEFSHQELNIEQYNTTDHINSAIQNSLDMYKSEKLLHIPIEENDYLPHLYEIYLYKYIRQ